MLTKVSEKVRTGRLWLLRLLQSDPGQKRAADSVLHFFAAMLLLTLLARGVSGVTVPTVTIVYPEQGEVSQRITVDATVAAEQSRWLEVPAGLTVQRVFCHPGQSVAADEPVVAVDLLDIAAHLEQEQLLLAQLELNRQSHERQRPPDTGDVDAAQLRLQRAQVDQTDQEQAGRLAVEDASRECEAATERQAETEQQLRSANRQLDRAAGRLRTAEAAADRAASDQWEAEAELAEVENTANLDLLRATQRLSAAERAAQQAETEEERLAAEAELGEAQQSYDQKQIRGQQRVAAARQAYNEAVQEAREAADLQAERQTDHQRALSDQQTAETAKQQAEVASQAAERTLQTAKSSAADALESANRALEDARMLLQQSQRDYESAAQQASEQTALDRVEAGLLQWEIQEKQQLIDALRELQQDEGIVAAPCAGSVASLAVQAGERSSGQVVRLTDAAGGYSLTISLGSTQYQELGADPVVRFPLGAGTVELPLPVLGQMEADGSHTGYLSLPEGDYVTGQKFQVTVESGRQYGDLCLPVDAIRRDAEGYYVLQVEQRKTVLGLQNTLVRVPVELEAGGDQRVAVTGALTRASLVVGNCSRPLRAGDRVRVRSE